MIFTAADLRGRLKERPFQPFRFIVTEGLRYAIHHPDLVFVGVRDCMIGFADPATPHAYDRVVRVAYVHIVAIEDLPVIAGATNGIVGE